MAEQHKDQALEGIDASFLYAESASVVMQTVKVAVFEPGSAAGFELAALREVVSSAAARLPALRRVLVLGSVWLHHPRWIDVAQLDVDAHLEHLEIGPEADDEALERLTGEAAQRRLPRHRPLWRLTVVTGLRDQRLAAIVTLHHSVADGGAALGLLEALTASQPGAWTAPDFCGDSLGTQRPPWFYLLGHGLWARICSLTALPKLVWTSIRGALRTRGLGGAKLFVGPRTFFNRALGRTREYTHLELPLADLFTIKAGFGQAGFGVTINDVVLALVSGAAGRLRAAGELRGHSLICSMPVGVDAHEHGELAPRRLQGNRVANAIVDLHDDLSDPSERVRAIAGSTRTAKSGHQLRGPGRLLAWAEFDAPPWQPLIWAVVRRLRRPPLNLIVSHMRGPDQLRYCGHLQIDRLWFVGPLVPRVGLNVTVWSYANTVYVSLLADGGQWTRARLQGLRAGLEAECAVLRALVEQPDWARSAATEPPRSGAGDDQLILGERREHADVGVDVEHALVAGAVADLGG